MSADKQTVATYDKSAQQMAEHFQQYKDGAARQDLDKAFELAGNPSRARVVEIGCGAGKEAVEIVKRAIWYEGFDPSQKLLEIARGHVPAASFVQADAQSYTFPENLDIVFAFASMLHLDKTDFAAVCARIATALRPGGVLCMTLKEADEYAEKLQEDQFGRRLFFLYTSEMVQGLAGERLEKVYERHDLVGPRQKRWFSIVFRKVS